MKKMFQKGINIAVAEGIIKPIGKPNTKEMVKNLKRNIQNLKQKLLQLKKIILKNLHLLECLK